MIKPVIDKILFVGSGRPLVNCISYFSKNNCFQDNIIYINKKNDLTVIPENIVNSTSFLSKSDFLNNSIKYSEFLIISLSIPFKVPKKTLENFKKGIINVHHSLLPNYRGIHPINWAIINGDSSTGVTIHWMDESLDTGPIIVQKKVEISFEDDINTLSTRLNNLSSKLTFDLLSKFEFSKNLPKGKIQFDKISNKYASRRYPADSEFKLNNNNLMMIYNFCRALYDPYPNAFLMLNNYKYRIKRIIEIIYFYQRKHYLIDFLSKLDFNKNLYIINSSIIILKALDGYLVCNYNKSTIDE